MSKNRRLIISGERIVGVEDSGHLRGIGNWFQSWEIGKQGEVVHINFGDHCCSSDRFNEPIDKSEVPEDVAVLLGLA